MERKYEALGDFDLTQNSTHIVSLVTSLTIYLTCMYFMPYSSFVHKVQAHNDELVSHIRLGQKLIPLWPINSKWTLVLSIKEATCLLYF